MNATMKPSQNFRSLHVECLENRIVFAGNLAAVTVSVQHEITNLIAPSHSSLTSEGEGSGIANSNTISNLHVLLPSASIVPAASTSQDSIGTRTHSPSAVTHSTATTSSSHALKSSESMAFPASMDGNGLSVAASMSGVLLAGQQQGLSSLESSSDIAATPRSSTPLLRARSVDDAFMTHSPLISVSDNSSDRSIDKTRLRSLGLSGERPTESVAGKSRIANRPNGEQTPDGAWVEISRNELFAKSFPSVAMPKDTPPSTPHSWSLLFGVVQSTSPFSDDAEPSDLASKRQAVLKLVAQSEEIGSPSATPSSHYASNGWKATGSLLAAAFAAVVYHQRKNQDLQPIQLQGVATPSRRSKRVPR
jgi:hypothetical protein